ncbi:MAG: hypothetical protein KC457_29380, partial [Myxococcales bacterium]|nr:hypothetical protein [Myxococcales bacterium]
MLSAHQVRAQLLAGIAEDPFLLGRVLDEDKGPRLFVFCCSESFEEGALRRAEGMFGARKGPRHQQVSVLWREDAVDDVGGQIVRALERAQSGDRHGAGDSQSGTRMRDVVGVTGLSAVGTDALPARRLVAARPVLKVPVSKELELGLPDLGGDTKDEAKRETTAGPAGKAVEDLGVEPPRLPRPAPVAKSAAVDDEEDDEDEDDEPDEEDEPVSLSTEPVQLSVPPPPALRTAADDEEPLAV